MKFDAATVQSVIDNAKFYPYINDQVKSVAKTTKPDLRMVKVRLTNSQVASVTLRTTDGLTVCKLRPSFEKGMYRQRRQVETDYAEFASVTPLPMLELVVKKIVAVCNRLGVGIATEDEPVIVGTAETAEPIEIVGTAETAGSSEETETVPEVAPEVAETAQTETAQTAPEFKLHFIFKFYTGEARYANIVKVDGGYLTDKGEMLDGKEYIVKQMDTAVPV